MKNHQLYFSIAWLATDWLYPRKKETLVVLWHARDASNRSLQQSFGVVAGPTYFYPSCSCNSMNFWECIIMLCPLPPRGPSDNHSSVMACTVYELNRCVNLQVGLIQSRWLKEKVDTSNHFIDHCKNKIQLSRGNAFGKDIWHFKSLYIWSFLISMVISTPKFS